VTADDWNESAGQEAEFPEHVSATSQAPAEALQVTADDWKVSAGQEAEDPEHVSATSQGPLEDLQVVEDGLKVQVEVQQSPPSHCSDGSTTPFPQTEVIVIIWVIVAVLPHSSVADHTLLIWDPWEQAPGVVVTTGVTVNWDGVVQSKVAVTVAIAGMVPPHGIPTSAVLAPEAERTGWTLEV